MLKLVQITFGKGGERVSAPLNTLISCSSTQTLVLIALNIFICDNKIQVDSLSFMDFLYHKEKIIASLLIFFIISWVSIFSLLGELINASSFLAVLESCCSHLL